MATDEEHREAGTGLILGLVCLALFITVLVLAKYCDRSCDYQPQPEPAGEHSVLIER